jgi:hypothetical protein
LKPFLVLGEVVASFLGCLCELCLSAFEKWWLCRVTAGEASSVTLHFQPWGRRERRRAVPAIVPFFAVILTVSYFDCHSDRHFDCRNPEASVDQLNAWMAAWAADKDGKRKVYL